MAQFFSLAFWKMEKAFGVQLAGKNHLPLGSDDSGYSSKIIILDFMCCTKQTGKQERKKKPNKTKNNSPKALPS